MTKKRFADAVAELRLYGITLRKSDREYRVNKKAGTEATAYYTGSLNDAIDTGKAMSVERVADKRNADRIDGFDRDDLGLSPDY